MTGEEIYLKVLYFSRNNDKDGAIALMRTLTQEEFAEFEKEVKHMEVQTEIAKKFFGMS